MNLRSTQDSNREECEDLIIKAPERPLWCLVGRIYNNCSKIIFYFVSSIVIAFGLSLGFYIAFIILNPMESLRYISLEVGEEFIRGIQQGLNETALNVLVKKLTGTVIEGVYIQQTSPVTIYSPKKNQ